MAAITRQTNVVCQNNSFIQIPKKKATPKGGFGPTAN